MTHRAKSSNVSWEDLGIITCPLCHLKTSDQGLFQAHNCKPRKPLETPPLNKANISYSTITKKFYCSICNIEMYEKQIENHMENHITVNPYECHYCRLQFGSQFKVFQHCSSHHTTAEPLYLLRVSSKTKELIRKVKLKGIEFYVPLNFNVVPVKKSELPLNNDNKKATMSSYLVSTSVNHGENSSSTTLNLPREFCHSKILDLATHSKILAPTSVITTSAQKSFPVVISTSWTDVNNPLLNRQNLHLITCIDKTKQTLNSKRKFSHPKEDSAECPDVSMKGPIELLNAPEKEITLIKDNSNLDVINETASSWEILGNHSRNELNSQPNLPIDNFNGHSPISENVSQATFLNGHDYLRVVKGYFLCLKCKMKWSSDYDSFFKHIWTYHIHGEDFSCCPDGYSVKCLQLKTVLKSVYDKSQETMSDIIKSYLQFDSAVKEINSVNNAETNAYVSNSVTNCPISPSSNSDLTQKSQPKETSSLNTPSNLLFSHAPDSTFLKRLNSLNRAERYSTESSEAGSDLGDEGLKSFYQCGQLNCTYASIQPVDLLLHSEQSHGAEVKFPCIYCGFPASSISILLDHMNQHIGSDHGYVFSCSVLDSSHVLDRFESQDLKHILGRYEEMLKTNKKSNLCFACNTCDTQFKSLGELKEHLQKFLLKVVRCKHCRSYFLDTSSWQKHRAKEHPNESRLYCINRKLLCDARKKNFTDFEQLTEKRRLCPHFLTSNTNLVLVSNNNMLENIDSLGINKVNEEKGLLSQPFLIQMEASALHKTRSLLTSNCDICKSKNNSMPVLLSDGQSENCGIAQKFTLTNNEMAVVESNSLALNNSENLDDITTLNNEQLSELTSEENKQFVKEANTVAKIPEKHFVIERAHEVLTELTDQVLNPQLSPEVSETFTEIITLKENNRPKGLIDCEQIDGSVIGSAKQSESEVLEISAQQAHPEINSEISGGLEIPKVCFAFKSSSNLENASEHFYISKDMDCKICSDSTDYIKEIVVKAEALTSTELCVSGVSNETKALSLLNKTFTPVKSQQECRDINENQNQEINSLELNESDVEFIASPVLESTVVFNDNGAVNNDEQIISLCETTYQKEWNTKLTPTKKHKASKRLLNSNSNKEVPTVKVKKSNSLPNSPPITEVISVISDENLNVNSQTLENKIPEEKKKKYLKTGLKPGIKRKTIHRYSCIHDGCSFVSTWHKTLMSNHVRTKHPYCSCGYCGAIYFFRNHLINHLRFSHREMEPSINNDVPLEKLFEAIKPQVDKLSLFDKYCKGPLNNKDVYYVSGEIKNNEPDTEMKLEYTMGLNEKDLQINKKSEYTNLKYAADNEMHSAGPNNHSNNKKNQPLSCADMSLTDLSSAKNVKSSAVLESSDTINQRKRKRANEKLKHISATKKNKASKHTNKSSIKSCKTSKIPIESLSTEQISFEHSLHVNVNSEDSTRTPGKVIDILSKTLLSAQIKNYQTSPVSRRKNVIQPIKKRHMVDKSATLKEIMSITVFPFQCDVCKSCFKSLNDIEEHFKMLHLGENETFIDRETSSTYTITGKFLNSKPGMKPNPSTLCKYCSFRKDTRSEVEEHIRHVHPENNVTVTMLGIASLPLATSIRESKINSTTNNLSTTPKATSTSSLIYNCNKCGDQHSSEFLFRFHLAQHGGFKHTNILTTTTGLLVCPICGYFASSHHDLGQHTGTHLNERRYKCSHCDFDGHNKPSVNYHLSTTHCGLEGVKIIDRNKRSKMHLQPTLVNMQPQVELKNALLYAGYLSELLIKNDIKNIELTSDICAHIFKHNSEQYFDVVPIDESE